MVNKQCYCYAYVLQPPEIHSTSLYTGALKWWVSLRQRSDHIFVFQKPK